MECEKGLQEFSVEKIKKSKESSRETAAMNAVWREKKVDGGVVVEKKLVDYDEKSLNLFYNLCWNILYNNDKLMTGKAIILKEIQEQKEACNIVMFIRWMRKKYGKSEYTLRSSLQKLVSENISTRPNIENYKIKRLMDYCPDEFSQITVSQVMKGCVDALGAFNKRRISRKMLYNLGVYLTEEDKKELVPTNEERKLISRYYDSMQIPYKVTKKGIAIVSKSDIMKVRLGLKINENIKFSLNGMSYKQFEAAIKLGSIVKYSEMSDIQLELLRNRLLPILESNLSKKVEEWKKRMTNIKIVAQLKGYRLTTPTGETVEL